MDASVESFVKYRVNRLSEISQQITWFEFNNLIPEICRLIEFYATKRPEGAFFEEARGTRFVRSDLKYWFPAVLGIDIRPYLKGEHLLFDPTALREDLKKKWKIEEKQALISVSRLIFLLSSYNLHILPVKDKFGRRPEFSPYLKTIEHNSEEICHLLEHYLETIIDVPMLAKKIHMREGVMEWTPDQRKAETMNQKLLKVIKQGQRNIDYQSLENLFENICSGNLYQLKEETFTLDPQNHIEINVSKFIKTPIIETNFMKVIKHQYNVATYLNTFYQDEHAEQLIDQFSDQLKDNFEETGIDLEDDEIKNIAQFLMNPDQLDTSKYGFYFDSPPKEDQFLWKNWERRSNYLGERPKDWSSPDDIKLPQDIVISEKRPVCVLFDVSSSMSPCLDIALRAAEELLYELKGHPVSLVTFSAMAGVLQSGIPFISQGKAFKDEITWLYPMIEAVHKGQYISNRTSIGNGVLLGQRLAYSLSKNMKNSSKWLQENRISSHFVLISDNLHNSPRDLSSRGSDGNLVIDSAENVIKHALHYGCSTHNLVLSFPPTKTHQFIGENGQKVLPNTDEHQKRENKGIAHGSLAKRIQNMRYIGVLLKDFLHSNKTPIQREIRSQLNLYFVGSQKNNTTEVRSAHTKEVLFQMKQTEPFGVDAIDLACFIVYIKDRVLPSGPLRDALDFLIKESPLSYESFTSNPIEANTIAPFYLDLTLSDEIDLGDEKDNEYDCHPMAIFDVSHFIAASQKELMNLNVSPEILDLPEPIARARCLLKQEHLDAVYQEIKAGMGLSMDSGEIVKNVMPQLVGKAFDSYPEFIEAVEQISGISRMDGVEHTEDGITFVRNFHHMLADLAMERFPYCSPAYFGMSNMLTIKKSVRVIVDQIRELDLR